MRSGYLDVSVFHDNVRCQRREHVERQAEGVAAPDQGVVQVVHPRRIVQHFVEDEATNDRADDHNRDVHGPDPHGVARGVGDHDRHTGCDTGGHYRGGGQRDQISPELTRLEWVDGGDAPCDEARDDSHHKTNYSRLEHWGTFRGALGHFAASHK